MESGAAGGETEQRGEGGGKSPQTVSEEVRTALRRTGRAGKLTCHCCEVSGGKRGREPDQLEPPSSGRPTARALAARGFTCRGAGEGRRAAEGGSLQPPRASAGLALGPWAATRRPSNDSLASGSPGAHASTGRCWRGGPPGSGHLAQVCGVEEPGPAGPTGAAAARFPPLRRRAGREGQQEKDPANETQRPLPCRPGVWWTAPPPAPGKQLAHTSAGRWARVQAEGAGSRLGFQASPPEQPRLTHPTWEAGEGRPLPESLTPRTGAVAFRWLHDASSEVALAAGPGEGEGTGTWLKLSLGLSSRQWGTGWGREL